VATVDTLSLPFATWQEGLLALAAALQDPNREKIVVARLEATAAQIGIGPMEVCALALLVPSRARFEPLPRPEPHPDAVRLAAVADADGRLWVLVSTLITGSGSGSSKKTDFRSLIARRHAAEPYWSIASLSNSQ